MRILLLCHSFNSLTQRLHVELRERGHDVSVEFDINDAMTRQAVDLFRPDVVIASFLKRAIPEVVWRGTLCLIVHPGIPGDRGPSALDWAILRGDEEWGVTVLQAEAEMDGGPVWAHGRFPMREATKSSLYRNEVTEAAVAAVLEALGKLDDGRSPAGDGVPSSGRQGRDNPVCRQADRAIDWATDDTQSVLRKIRSADGTPGIRDRVSGNEVYLFDAAEAEGLSGPPGALIGRAGITVARATVDGAVWLGHMKPTGPKQLKLPATVVLGERAIDLPPLPETPAPDPICYEEKNGVGYLHFAFYNGAFDTAACRHLRRAFLQARERPTRVICLMGGPDYWSNGIHLGLIEAADSPADESWDNINAIDDLVRDIITTTSHLVVAAIRGNAGAGGVFLALGADEVIARDGVILNPHYKDMGNLYGSEYWTYVLPRRAGSENAERVTQARLPVGVGEAKRLKLVDGSFAGPVPAFDIELAAHLEALAADPALAVRLREKEKRLATDSAEKPLERYRDEELERMNLNFYGFDPSHHVARYNFIRKVPKSRTPVTLANHRSKKKAG